MERKEKQRKCEEIGVKRKEREDNMKSDKKERARTEVKGMERVKKFISAK